MNLDIAEYQGGKRLMVIAGLVGVVGLVLTGLGLTLNTTRALHSYLIAFAYWVGLAVAALILLMVFHTAKARWIVVLRRQIENFSASIPIFVVLFIPVALGMNQLYEWVDPKGRGLHGEHLELIEHKVAYLNQSGFVIRTAIYFAIWIVISHLLRSWSLKQDAGGDLALTTRQRRLGAGGLPLLALSITFASFDWLMSLTPTWFSTIYGVYYFSGSFLGVICLLTLVTTFAKQKDLYGRLVSEAHFHNLGKLMLAFVAFWGYIAFSQLLLIWVANIPEEVPYYLLRLEGPWYGVSIALGIGQFLIPFFVLLSRDLKYRPRALSVVAVYLLLVHWLDIYWLVMPALQPDSPMPSWTDLTAFIGVGGIAVAFAVFRMRGHYTVPVGDPYLQDSLRYVQP